MAVSEFVGKFEEFARVTVATIALRLAVIEVVPVPVVVAIPEASMVATAVLLDIQSTWLVMSCIWDGWPPPRLNVP
jgi:hypothetical protein